jgi:hypothetical protein
MGPPDKIVVKGEAVFLCCAGCRRKATADAAKTLAAVAALKRGAAHGH